jgi:copper chaperone CopZ
VDLDKSEAQVTADREISLEELKKALEMTNYQVVNIIN